MTTIKQQYESRDIRNIKTAVSAMNSLMANDFNEGKRKYAKIAMAIPIKQAKQRATQDKKLTVLDDQLAEIVEKTVKLDNQIGELVEKVDKEIHKPGIKTRSWESEAPSTEIKFKQDYNDFNDAWKAGSKLLIKAVSAHFTKKQPNMKLFIGIEHTVVKQSIDYEDQDPDEIRLKEVGKPKPMAAKTKPVNVYNLESVNPTIL
jgi:hypothetical protein